jgi:hypothetical protein
MMPQDESSSDADAVDPTQVAFEEMLEPVEVAEPSTNNDFVAEMTEIYQGLQNSISGLAMGMGHFFPIFIKPLSGNTITLELMRTDTIVTLKAMLSAKTGISRNDVRLSFRGKALDDAKQLQWYAIEKESTVHMSSHLDGGAPKVKRTIGKKASTSSVTKASASSSTTYEEFLLKEKMSNLESMIPSGCTIVEINNAVKAIGLLAGKDVENFFQVSIQRLNKDQVTQCLEVFTPSGSSTEEKLHEITPIILEEVYGPLQKLDTIATAVSDTLKLSLWNLYRREFVKSGRANNMAFKDLLEKRLAELTKPELDNTPVASIIESLQKINI